MKKAGEALRILIGFCRKYHQKNHWLMSVTKQQRQRKVASKRRQQRQALAGKLR
jgi:hypothetical protein